MFKETLHVLKGNFLWHYLKARHGIGERSALLILTGENEKVDSYAVQYLQAYVQRCKADRVYVWTGQGGLFEKARKACSIPVRRFHMTEKQLRLLFDYYCFYRFFPNPVFTYINQPKDNQLGKLLLRGGADEEDIVCLGLYNLRIVPGKNKS